MSDSLKSKTIRGAFWTGIERVANQLVGFVVSIILARLLIPSDYGTVGLLAVFLSISALFFDAVFTSALIGKKDCTDTDQPCRDICGQEYYGLFAKEFWIKG